MCTQVDGDASFTADAVEDNLLVLLPLLSPGFHDGCLFVDLVLLFAAVLCYPPLPPGLMVMPASITADALRR
jgi:hypothetical protein